MIRISRVSLLLATLLTMTSLGIAQIDQQLNYHYGQGANDFLKNRVLYGCSLSDRPTDVNFPAFTASDPLFATWSIPDIAGEALWLALDRSSPDQPYDRLFVDADGDGDWSDEQPLQPNGNENNNWVDFSPVELSFPHEGGLIVHHLNVMFDPHNDFFIIGSACCYEAKILIGGLEYQVVLKDNNNNGSFTDTGTRTSQADCISITSNEEYDFRAVGQYVEIEEVLYSMQILEHGARLRLAKAENVTYGQIQVPEKINQIQFISELGQFDRIPQNGSVSLPQGMHHINRWTIERKDDQGRQWKAQGTNFNDEGWIRVAATDTSFLKIGEPLQSTLNMSRRDGNLYFSQDLAGPMGEFITLFVDGEQADAPQLHVRDKTGKQIETLNFEYG